MMTARDYIWEQIKDYMLNGAIERIVSRAKEKHGKIINSEAFRFLAENERKQIEETYSFIISLDKKDVDLEVINNKKEIKKFLSDWKSWTGYLI